MRPNWATVQSLSNSPAHAKSMTVRSQHFSMGDGAEAQANVTLTTQCSLDRWPNVQRQCRSWDGPVSVAVYVPAPRHTREAHACEQLIRGLASRSAAAPPPLLNATAQQASYSPLHISLLYANHHAREGADVLREYLLQEQRQQQQQQQQQQLWQAQRHNQKDQHPEQAGDKHGQQAVSTSNDAPSQPTYDQLYPINALRNLALDAACTELVMLVDGDFVPSRGAAQQAERIMSLLPEAQRHRTALVLPAFEMTAVPVVQATRKGETEHRLPGRPSSGGSGGALEQRWGRMGVGGVAEDEAVPRTKGDLVAAWREGRVTRFHCGKWAPLQESLDYEQWLEGGAARMMAGVGEDGGSGGAAGAPGAAGAQGLQADGGSGRLASGGSSSSSGGSSGSSSSSSSLSIRGGDAPLPQGEQGVFDLAYEVPYHEYWEPVCIACRSALPPYDAGFKGYGLNKVQHAYHMAALGFRFMVMREHFVVTMPHPRSPSFRAAFGTSADPQHVAWVQDRYEAFKHGLS